MLRPSSNLLQISSPAHAFDLTLYKFRSVAQDLAASYQKVHAELPDAERPSESVIRDCMNTTWTKEYLTDEVIANIASRWYQVKYLRQLYLDDRVAQDFQDFHVKFAQKQQSDNGTKLVKGGVKTSGQPHKGHHFGSDFKTRFHRSVSLLAMAVISHNVARLAVEDDSQPADPDYPKDLSSEITFDVMDTWSKDRVVVGGVKYDLDLDIKLDCLEVYDFLYHFLLKKAMPFDKVIDWTEEEEDNWPYQAQDDVEAWQYLVYHSRWILEPLDLVDLIKNEAWTGAYPEDKRQYMQIRGMFDNGADISMDWYSLFERASMTHALLPSNTPYKYTGPDTPDWWDKVRLNLGSPFQPGFLTQFLAATREKRKKKIPAGSNRPQGRRSRRKALRL